MRLFEIDLPDEQYNAVTETLTHISNHISAYQTTLPYPDHPFETAIISTHTEFISLQKKYDISSHMLDIYYCTDKDSKILFSEMESHYPQIISTERAKVDYNNKLYTHAETIIQRKYATGIPKVFTELAELQISLILAKRSVCGFSGSNLAEEILFRYHKAGLIPCGWLGNFIEEEGKLVAYQHT